MSLTKTDCKLVAVIEPRDWGHHPTYVKLLCEDLLKKGMKVVCCYPEPNKILNQLTGVADKVSNFHPAKIDFPRLHEIRRLLLRLAPRSSSQFWLSNRLWQSATEAIEKHIASQNQVPDIAFFPMLDDYLVGQPNQVDRFPCPWTGVCLYPNWLLTSPRQVPIPLTSKQCLAVFFLDESLTGLARELVRKPCLEFPDVTNEDVAATPLDCLWQQSIDQVDAKAKKIGLFGVLDFRKGVIELVEIAKRLEHSDYQVFIFGEGTGWVGKLQATLAARRIKNLQQTNVHFVRGLIPDGAIFNQLVQQMDLVWLGYRHYPYSSNQLTKTAMLNTPAIVSEGGLLDRRVQEYSLGLSAPIFQPDETASMIVKFLDSVDENPRSFAAYFSKHSQNQLSISMNQVLELV